ncbi:MAG: SMP-30/gluconolactonase/LRE family protein, partial [Solirubrobacteraceae bacterium]
MTGLELAQLRKLADGLDHPEGIALGPDGALYAGGEAGQVYRIDPLGGGHEQIADTAGFALGVCLDAQGIIYVCDPGNAAVMRVDAEAGTVERWCEAAGGVPLKTPNWAAFDVDGSMWLSDSGTEALDVKDGRLVRVP